MAQIPIVRGFGERDEPQEMPEQEEAEHAESGPNGEKCSECYFYGSDNQCRRYPQAVAKSPSDWSGEFKPRDGQMADDESLEAGESGAAGANRGLSAPARPPAIGV